jgi:hypothetical protein
MDVTQGGIAQKLKQGQPGRQQAEKEKFVRQLPPAVGRVLPKSRHPGNFWAFTHERVVFSLLIKEGRDSLKQNPDKL